MLSKVNSIALRGLEGYWIEVQVDISSGMPCWEIVRTTRYQCERSKRACKNSNKKFWL